MPDSASPPLRRAGGIVGASLFIGRVLCVVRDIAFAARLGSTAYTDAFWLAFLVPDILFFLVAGGALGAAFVPVFSEFLSTDREREAWSLFGAVVSLVALSGLLFGGLCWVFAARLAPLVAPGKSDSLQPLVGQTSRVLVPAQFALLLGTVLYGALYARGKLAIPSLASNIANLGMIFGVLGLAGFCAHGMDGAAWGALAGALVGSLILPLSAMRKVGGRFVPSLNLRTSGVKQVFSGILPVSVGLGMPTLFLLVAQIFATYYEAGANTLLEYSAQVALVPVGIFGFSFALAAYPSLSQFRSLGRMDLFRTQLDRTLRTALYITLPISALMAVLAPIIVRALFEWGRFQAADAERCSPVLSLLSLGIFAWCLHPILVRALLAAGDRRTPIVMGSSAALLFPSFLLLAGRTTLGLPGLALGGTVGAAVLLLPMLLMANRRFGPLGLMGLAQTFLRSAACSGVAALAIYILLRAFAGRYLLNPGVSALAEALFLGLVGAWIYYHLTRLLGMQEAGTMRRTAERLEERGAP